MSRAIWYTPKLDRLMALLSSRGWTWAELARQSGRDRPHLSRVLGGHHKAGPGLAEDIAAALGVGIGEIWETAS